MNTVKSVLGLVVATVALAGRVHVAAADTSQTSTVAQLTVIEAGDKNYKAFHGAVWLEIDKAATNYRWGGTQCGGRDISENTIQLLFAAFRSGDQVSLEYTVAVARGGSAEAAAKQYRCVTAVTFSKT